MKKTDLDSLVQTDRIHKSVYTDQSIFDLEMERIFGQTWIYVGHESQVKNPGDFFCTRIGKQPVVLTRHKDNKIHVLFNRCGHRGAMVLREETGNASTFNCCYHDWQFDTDGSLLSVPLRNGYPADFRLDDPEKGMKSVARVDHYRGFIFANLAPDGPTLEEHLGYIATSFDDLIDRAPDGEVEVAGGTARHAYNGNWKLYLENLCDGLHPNSVHRSSIESARAQDDQVYSNGAGEIAVRQMRQNGAPYAFWENQVGLWAYPNGHAYLGDFHDDEKLIATLEDPYFKDYLKAMREVHGEKRTRDILSVGRWNTNVFPNVSFMSQFRQLRVIQPISVDRTIVLGFCFRLKGAPEQMFRDTINFANITNAVASPVLTDDLETYARIKLGLSSDGTEWIPMAREIGKDKPDGHGGWMAANGTSELHIRNAFRTWKNLMNTAPQ